MQDFPFGILDGDEVGGLLGVNREVAGAGIGCQHRVDGVENLLAALERTRRQQQRQDSCLPAGCDGSAELGDPDTALGNYQVRSVVNHSVRDAAMLESVIEVG